MRLIPLAPMRRVSESGRQVGGIVVDILECGHFIQIFGQKPAKSRRCIECDHNPKPRATTYEPPNLVPPLLVPLMTPEERSCLVAYLITVCRVAPNHAQALVTVSTRPDDVFRARYAEPERTGHGKSFLVFRVGWLARNLDPEALGAFEGA